MNPKSIYKYMPTYAEKFFEHFLLRATPRNELNDPFDFVPTKIFFDWVNKTSETKGLEKINYDLCCKGFLPSSGVLSFSETNSNLLMWAHYTEGHKGIVIEFDTTESFFTSLRRVSYNNVKPNEIEKLEDIFFIKSDEWIYEKEYRLVKDLIKHNKVMARETEEINPATGAAICSPNECPEFYMFAVPPQSVVSVIFGCNASKPFKARIIKIISANPLLSNVSIYDATISDTHFHLVFNEFII